MDAFRRVIEGLNRRDTEAVLSELDPAIEWQMALQSVMGGESAVYHGHAGVRRYIRDMDDAFADVEVDYPDVRDLGDRVLAIGRFRIRGKGSDVEIESPVAALADIKDGRGTRVLTFLDVGEALKAAGLSE